MSERLTAGRLVSTGSALLNLSVLADSATEHYRGGFRDPFMALPLIASAAGAALETADAAAPANPSPARGALRGLSSVIGLMGLGFHAYNVIKRVGGLSFGNLFYGAPVGAPAALTLSGLLGALGDRLRRGEGEPRAVGALAAVGLAGTVGEAALLHHRGAFHNKVMWAPVVLPPLAAAALALDVAQDRKRPLAGLLLGATAVLGLAGSAFHAWGVQRHMGGWRNWRQNLLDGPPIPAPPAFTGLALAALGAWMLLGGADD